MAELNKNALDNIWLETIRTMTEREIAYKANIHKEISSIKLRQKISIFIGTLALLIIAYVGWNVTNNINQINLLIHVLTESLKSLQ